MQVLQLHNTLSHACAVSEGQHAQRLDFAFPHPAQRRYLGLGIGMRKDYLGHKPPHPTWAHVPHEQLQATFSRPQAAPFSPFG